MLVDSCTVYLNLHGIMHCIYCYIKLIKDNVKLLYYTPKQCDKGWEFK